MNSVGRILGALLALVLLSGCGHLYEKHKERELGEQMIKEGWGKEGQQ